MDGLPLHLLPPHIKLNILAKLEQEQAAKSSSQQQLAEQSNDQTNNSSNNQPLFTINDAPLPSPATHEHMQKLLTEGFCIIDNFLKSSDKLNDQSLDRSAKVRIEIDSMLSSGVLKPMSMRSGNTDTKWASSDVRGDVAQWLNDENASNQPIIQSILQSIHDFMNQLGAAMSDFPHTPSGSSQVAVYDGSDARYVRHRDTFEGGPQRRITVIWYANPHWQFEDGGQLRIFEPQQHDAEEQFLDIEPLFDRLLMFDSVKMDHEVLPSKARRAAITRWFK